MGKTYAALMAYILFFYVLSRIHIYIFLTYRRQGKDDHIEVEVKTLGNLVMYQMKVPVIAITDQDISWFVSEVGAGKERAKTHPGREQRFVRKVLRFYGKHPRRIRNLVAMFRHYKQIYKGIMDKITSDMTCEAFYWRTRMGSEDAAVTAVFTGVLWVVKEWIIDSFRRHIPCSSRPVVSVVPVFGAAIFETELQCIFRVRLSHVISAATRLININRKEEIRRV